MQPSCEYITVRKQLDADWHLINLSNTSCHYFLAALRDTVNMNALFLLAAPNENPQLPNRPIRVSTRVSVIHEQRKQHIFLYWPLNTQIEWYTCYQKWSVTLCVSRLKRWCLWRSLGFCVVLVTGPQNHYFSNYLTPPLQLLTVGLSERDGTERLRVYRGFVHSPVKEKVYMWENINQPINTRPLPDLRWFNLAKRYWKTQLTFMPFQHRIKKKRLPTSEEKVCGT